MDGYEHCLRGETDFAKLTSHDLRLTGCSGVVLLSCECKSLMPTMHEFLNCCQDGTNSSSCLGIILTNDDTSVEQMDYI